jgi:hypothetical protein
MPILQSGLNEAAVRQTLRFVTFLRRFFAARESPFLWIAI